MTYNIHITDSYKISKREFHNVLINREYEAHWHNIESEIQVFEHRSRFSLKMEWAVHNFLYAIGYKRAQTKDADLDYPCDKPEWIYCVLGCLVWIFIK